MPGGAEARTRVVDITLRAGAAALLVLEDAAGHRRQLRLAPELLADAATRDPHPRLAAAGPVALPAGTPADAKRPTLECAQAGGAVHTVYQARYFLDGVARDRGGLASVTVLGEPSLPADLQGCTERYFSALLDLEPGTNVIWLTAQDLAGNVASQTVTLVRAEPQWGREEHRLRATLPPLKNLGEGQQAAQAHAAVWGELGRKPRRFRLLERADGLEALLKEHQLSQSSLARPSAVLQAGRLETADLLLVGALIRDGTRGNTIQISVLETTQGEELFTEDVYSEDIDREMDYIAQGLVMKIKQRLPLAQGRVTRLDGPRALLELGPEDEVVTGSRFLVLRLPAGDTDPAAAVVCRTGERVVELTVTERRADGATATVHPAEARTLLQPGDAVYAR